MPKFCEKNPLKNNIKFLKPVFNMQGHEWSRAPEVTAEVILKGRISGIWAPTPNPEKHDSWLMYGEGGSRKGYSGSGVFRDNNRNPPSFMGIVLRGKPELPPPPLNEFLLFGRIAEKNCSGILPAKWINEYKRFAESRSGGVPLAWEEIQHIMTMTSVQHSDNELTLFDNDYITVPRRLFPLPAPASTTISAQQTPAPPAAVVSTATVIHNHFYSTDHLISDNDGGGGHGFLVPRVNQLN
jgi:hypothetical protein